MQADIPVKVEVRISDALARMFGGSATTLDKFRDGPEQPTVLAHWSEVSLRRDGKRPLTFAGLPVLERRTLHGLIPDQAEYSLSVYVSQTGVVYVQLGFRPFEGCRAWPSFQCAAIEDVSDFIALIRNWKPDQCLAPPTLRGDPVPSRRPLPSEGPLAELLSECLNANLLQG